MQPNSAFTALEAPTGTAVVYGEFELENGSKALPLDYHLIAQVQSISLTLHE